jgi:NitT/TauT family transport system permease protein
MTVTEVKPARSKAARSAESTSVTTRRAGAGALLGRLRSASSLFVLRIAFLALMIGAWWLVAHYELMDPTVTSSPGAVASWLGEALTGPVLWTNLQATLTATMIAWILASVVGVVVGITLALLPRFEAVVNPYISAFNAMPRIALAPLFVVAFGLTIQSKIALAFSIVVFLVLTAARSGVASVDLDLMRLADVLGANRREKFVKILLPVAVPSIFGGLRLGLIYGLLGTLTAELIGSVNGIGQQLQQAAGLFQTEAIYGLLVVLAVVSTLINSVMGLIERRLLRWQP